MVCFLVSGRQREGVGRGTGLRLETHVGVGCISTKVGGNTVGERGAEAVGHGYGGRTCISGGWRPGWLTRNGNGIP